MILLLSAGVLSPATVAQRPSPADFESPTGLWLVSFSEAPLVEHLATTGSLRQRRGGARLDLSSAGSRDYLARLDRLIDQRRDEMEQRLGRQVELSFRLRTVRSGVVLRLQPGEVEALRRLPWIASVEPDALLTPTSDRGPEWIGATTVWDGSQTGGLGGSLGEEIIVGVVDTGINPDHPSFSDQPGDGHVYFNPLGPGTRVGACDPADPAYDPSFPCNDKLIGARDFADVTGCETDGAHDDIGHGSHVASIAVGNRLEWPPLSGVAPHANLISYDVCYYRTTSKTGCVTWTSTCPKTAVIAAVDQAVQDGVHVLNLSLTGGKDPWGDALDEALLSATTAGVSVVASAGNQGGTGTSHFLGPWTLTVGASTHDRWGHANELVGLTGGSTLAPSDLASASLTTTGHGPVNLVYAGNYQNALPSPLFSYSAERCLEPFPAGTFSADEIVVCEGQGRPDIFFGQVLKGQNVAAGGAGGVVVLCSSDLYHCQPAQEPLRYAYAHPIPSAQLDIASSDALRSWLTAGSGHRGQITTATTMLDLALADRVWSSSSRGPASGFDLLKPDLVAPGVAILAADGDFFTAGYIHPEFNWRSGTSMAAPHAAGAVALLRSLHPGWTALEIKSALQTTAYPDLADGAFAADPHDVGSGRIDLSRAARAGLVLPESATNLADADPDLAGDPATLNVPSMARSACAGDCSWQRTLRSTVDSTVRWTISTSSPPGSELLSAEDTLTLTGPQATATLDVLLRITDPSLVDGTWHFGEVVLSPDDGSIPDARLPVAFVATGVSNSGVVEITKTVVGSAAPQPWEFTITPTDGCSTADVLRNPVSVPGGGGTARFLGVQVDGDGGPCHYTISEKSQAGWALDAAASDSLTGITTTTATPETVAIVNAELPGTIEVTVDVSGAVEGYVPGSSFELVLDCEGTSWDRTFTLADDQIGSLADVPAGTACSLSQTTRPALADGYSWRPPQIQPAATITVQRGASTGLLVDNPVLVADIFFDTFESGNTEAWSTTASP